MRGTDRRASVRGQAARHVPVAKHLDLALVVLQVRAHLVAEVAGGLHAQRGGLLDGELARHLQAESRVPARGSTR